jgi:hypothetical protein
MDETASQPVDLPSQMNKVNGAIAEAMGNQNIPAAFGGGGGGGADMATDAGIGALAGAAFGTVGMVIGAAISAADAAGGNSNSSSNSGANKKQQNSQFVPMGVGSPIQRQVAQRGPVMPRASMSYAEKKALAAHIAKGLSKKPGGGGNVFTTGADEMVAKAMGTTSASLTGRCSTDNKAVPPKGIKFSPEVAEKLGLVPQWLLTQKGRIQKKMTDPYSGHDAAPRLQQALAKNAAGAAAVARRSPGIAPPNMRQQNDSRT